MNTNEIITAHEHCTHHKEDIKRSSLCGCFYCLQTFTSETISVWIDEGTTALCPYCGVDSVIGEYSGYPITKEFLAEMKKHWF